MQLFKTSFVFYATCDNFSDEERFVLSQIYNIGRSLILTCSSSTIAMHIFPAATVRDEGSVG